MLEFFLKLHAMFPNKRLIYLAMGELICNGFNLAVLYPSDVEDKTCICIICIKGKMMGFIHIDWIYFVYIMSSCLRHYSVLYLIP